MAKSEENDAANPGTGISLGKEPSAARRFPRSRNFAVTNSGFDELINLRNMGSQEK